MALKHGTVVSLALRQGCAQTDQQRPGSPVIRKAKRHFAGMRFAYSLQWCSYTNAPCTLECKHREKTINARVGIPAPTLSSRYIDCLIAFRSLSDLKIDLLAFF